MKNIALRQTIKLVLIVWLLISANTVSAAPLPTWVNNLPLWQWHAIPNTALSSVEPSPRPCGVTGPKSKIVAWTGATLKRDGSIYMIGAAGGHADYCGNEVDALKLNTETPKWVQLAPPSPNSEVINESQFYRDLKPSAGHTYYNTQFINARNRMLIVANRTMSMRGLPSSPSGWPYPINSGYCASFNLATNDWDVPDYVSRYPGGGNFTAALVAKHPITEDIYFNAYAAGWWKWTQATNSWSKVSSVNEAGNYAGAAIDPIRNRMLIVGNYGGNKDPRVRDLNGTQISVSFGGLGASALRLGGYSGVIYDEVNDKFLVFVNDGNQIRVFRVDAANWTVDSPSIAGTMPSARINGIHNSVQYVPDLGGVVIANDYHGNVFFMRTSSAGASLLPPPSGDILAPTVPTAASGSAASPFQISLAWAASADNVGVTGYRIYRGGSQIASVAGANYQDSGLSAGTTYAYTVADYNDTGNTPAQSPSVNVTTHTVVTAPAPPPLGNQITSFQLTSPVGGTLLPFTSGLVLKKGASPTLSP